MLEPAEAIQKVMDDWSAALSAQDTARLLGLLTSDAVFLPSGYPPIRGLQAIEAMYSQFFPQFASVEQAAATGEIEVCGEWAFAWGSETMTLVPQSGGAPIRMQGKGLSLFRRQQDGSWKIARAISNSQPAPAA